MDSLTLNDENLVLINRNFFTIRQLNEPFIAIVINYDAVSVTFSREQEFAKCSCQICAVVFFCVHNLDVFIPYCRFLYFREWLEIMLLHKVLWPSAQGYGSKYNPNDVEILSHTIGSPWVDEGTTVTFAT